MMSRAGFGPAATWLAAALVLVLSTPTGVCAATRNGTDKGEIIKGTSKADAIDAKGGDDKVRGLDGDDRIEGGPGDDTLDGGPGDDRISGGDGADTADYASLSVADGGGYGLRSADLGEGRIRTSTLGIDQVAAVENLTGTRFKDNIYGDAGPNVLRGGAGEDYLDGKGGLNVLIGGTENDTFYSSYYEGDMPGRTTITDFVRGQDRFEFRVSTGDAHLSRFSQLDTNSNGRLDASDAYVRIGSVSSGGKPRTSTTLDFSALAGHAHTITFYGVTGLTASDFQ